MTSKANARTGQIQEAMGNVKRSLLELAQALATEGATESENAGEQLREELSKHTEAIGEAWRHGGEKVKDTATVLQDALKRNPALGLLAAFGIGFVVGLFKAKE